MTTRLSDSDLRDVEHALRHDVPPTLEQAKLMLAEVRASRSSTSGEDDGLAMAALEANSVAREFAGHGLNAECVAATLVATRIRALSPVESPGEERTTGGSTLPGAMRPEFVHAREVAVALSRVAAGDDPAQVEEDYGFPGGMLAHAHPAPAAAESTRADLDDLITRYGEAVQQQAIRAATGDPALIRAVRDARNDIRSAFAAAPREVEEVRKLIEAAREVVRVAYYANGPNGRELNALRAALARLSSAAGEAPERGDGLAPWNEADGSTVMLPAEEVERRRKLAAKVLDAARNLLDRRNLDGSLTVTRKFCDPLDRAIRDLDARPSPRGTGTEAP